MRRQRRGDADVYNHDARICLLGEHVYGCPAAQEVQHHLWRDFLGVCTDALSGYAVVGGHDYHCLALQRRLQGARDARNLHRQRFQAAQRTQGFGELILPGARGGHGRLIQGANAVEGMLH